MERIVIAGKKIEFAATRLSLLKRVKDGQDQESWSEFYRLYKPLITAVARGWGLSEEDAEDIGQETMITVAKALPQFEYKPEQCSFKGWLLQITRHRIIDQWRRRPVEQRPGKTATDSASLTDTEGPLPESTSEGVFAQIWEQEWQVCLARQAMDRLKTEVNPRHFQVFYLRVMKGLAPAEVASSLGVSRAQVYLVKQRLMPKFQRIIKELQAELE